MLKAAGYVDSPALGVWRITSRGRELLAAYPNGFDEERAKQVIRESRMGSQGAAPREDARGEQDTPLLPQPPDERIDDATSEIEQAVAQDLLERILQAPPAFFEQLVIDLLHGLGYGTGAGDSRRLGGSGDGGVDGVIALDRLGLEKVYIQAKRWQGSVGRPDVQAFFGALAGRRARKGVFITTSTFTREAKEYGDQMGENVVLIDGARLTRLMIENGVAVTHYRVVRLPRVDQDYFETT
jgi:restriction system protein